MTIVYKRLEHCYRLKVTGPIDIEGIAKRFVENCVTTGLNDDRSRYFLQLLASVAADYLSNSPGVATMATMQSYIDNVFKVTMDCLKDTGQLRKVIVAVTGSLFSANIEYETEWKYAR